MRSLKSFSIIICLVVFFNSVCFVSYAEGTNTWIKNDSFMPNDLTIYNNILWDGSKFIVVGDDGIIITSSDGENWTTQNSGTKDYLWGLAWNGKKYVTAARNREKGTTSICTSEDGIKWTTHSLKTTNFIENLAWLNGKFIAVGERGTILTSPDADKWTQQKSGTNEWLSDVIWDGKQYIVVGDKATILTSPDSINWTQRFKGAAPLEGIAYNGKQYVAVGAYSGVILTSADSIKWKEYKPAERTTFFAVKWNGNKFVAVGLSGSIQTSTDGTHWKVEDTGKSLSLDDIEWNGEKLVAVGSLGSILTCNPSDITKVTIDNKPLVFDVAPIKKDGRTLVPLRSIFEALGADVIWDGKTRTVTGTKGSKKVILKVDSKDATVNGEGKTLDVPATVADGRTMVPARFISESLGCQVIWNSETDTVQISTK